MSVAKSYAKALFESSAAAKSADPALLEEQLREFTRAVTASREGRVALFGPIATAKEKTAIIETLARKVGMAEPIMRFLVLLASKGRLPLLPEIQEAFSVVRVDAEGGVIGTVSAADPMNQEDLETLSRAFSKKLGKKVSFRVSTDPTLLAGMKVTVNGVTYDGSLRSQLQKLRDQLTAGAPRA